MNKLLSLAASMAVLAACGGPLKPSEKSATKHDLGGPYSGTVKGGSSFVISTNKVVAVKEVPKGDAAADPALEAFQSGLYPRLKANCTNGACHGGQNAFPFASPGLDLAFAAAKKYMNVDPEQSKMMQNIRSGHNGVDPAKADEFGPLIKAVAEKL